MLFSPLYLLLSLVLLMKYVEETTSTPMENEHHPVPVSLPLIDGDCTDTLKQRNILYVVDGSRSVGEDNFNLIKQELKRLSGKFTIGNTQIALIQCGDATETQVEFNFGEKKSLAVVNQCVNDMTYLSSIKTDFGACLKKAREQVFNGRGGDRSTAANNLIIFANAVATDSGQLDEAQKLKDAGVKIITVGIGDEDMLAQVGPTLSAWASVNSKTGQVLHFEAGFENLDDLTNQLAKEVC